MASERIATLAPERVLSMLAVAPVPCGGMAYDAATRRLLEDAAEHVDSRKTIINRSTGGRPPSSWVEWKAAYSASRSSRQAFAAYLRAWADTDFSERISGRHPVKVLVGSMIPRSMPG